MKYIVIGLGNYGGVLAEELSMLGNEIIGVDCNSHQVELLKDKIAASFIMDATDEESLSALPFNEVDTFSGSFHPVWTHSGRKEMPRSHKHPVRLPSGSRAPAYPLWEMPCRH